MLGYIIRRLLLMIPTLFGITFLVFMLLALTPGGIGASLRAAGGAHHLLHLVGDARLAQAEGAHHLSSGTPVRAWLLDVAEVRITSVKPRTMPNTCSEYGWNHVS